MHGSTKKHGEQLYVCEPLPDVAAVDGHLQEEVRQLKEALAKTQARINGSETA